MARPPTIPRTKVLQHMRDAFRARGYDGTTMASLSAATGLTSAALYHHYPDGKAAMAAAVLADVRDWSAVHILEPLKKPGEPLAKLREAAAALDELYEGGREPCLVGLFSLGEPLAQFQGRLQDSIRDLMSALAGVLVEAGLPAALADERALDAVIRIQGSLVVSRVLQDTGPFTRLLARLPEQLLEGCAAA